MSTTEALQRISDMDPKGERADDLGRAARVAREALASHATPTDQSAELAQTKRMFLAACEALGSINEALGLDPEDGGAEPILGAIEELQARAALAATSAPAVPMLNGLTEAETAETASVVGLTQTEHEVMGRALRRSVEIVRPSVDEAPAEPSVSTKPWTNNKMNPWVCTLTPHQARRVGKTGEEVGELGAVLGRLNIQGLHEIDPSSGKTNFQRLWEESADVEAQTTCNRKAFNFPEPEYTDRVMRKVAQMGEWEEHYSDATLPAEVEERRELSDEEIDDMIRNTGFNPDGRLRKAIRAILAASKEKAS